MNAPINFQEQKLLNDVAQLSNNHPKSVKTLLDTAKAVAEIQPSAALELDPSKPGKVVDAVYAYAQDLAVAEHVIKARNSALTQITPKLRSALRKNADHYINEIFRPLGVAAETYVTEINSLPESFTTADLPDLEPSELESFREARDAANVIRNVRTKLAQAYRVLYNQSLPNGMSDLLLVLPALNDSGDMITDLPHAQVPEVLDPELAGIIRVSTDYGARTGIEFGVSTIEEVIEEVAQAQAMQAL